ncbi:MAG: questin oxidase family protein [Candidatus Acidiferrales bacterium]
MESATFKSLLKQIQESDLLRFNTKQNHAPMVLIAMYRMGANESQLRSYFSKLEIATDSTDAQKRLAINHQSWKEYLGRFDALGSYCHFFQSEVGTLGTETALRTYVPALLGGVTAHAFHPLLRLAYGIDVSDDTEIALALAYWAATYLPGPQIPEDKPEIAPGDLLKKVASLPSLRAIKPDSRSIAARIHQFYSHSDFRDTLQPIRFDAKDPLKGISLAISEAFVDNHHFTMLHGVTGCCALRFVLPHICDQRKAISEYWYSICAAYMSVANLPGDKGRTLPESNLDWASIQNQALATGVEHTIKLTYACFREWEYYRRDSYRSLAIRDIGAPAPFY